MGFEQFSRWYIEPLEGLRELPNGNGGWVALAVACFLYERYASAVLNIERPGTQRIARQLAQDFQVNIETAEIFWKKIRHGLLHQGSPGGNEIGSDGDLGLFMHENLEVPFEIGELVIGQKHIHCLGVQPWKFCAEVISLWKSHPDLLRSPVTNPWPLVLSNQIEAVWKSVER